MLKNKIEIYVPSNTETQKRVVQNVFKTFCKAFGGATVNPVMGGWIDDKGDLITDKIDIVYAYVPTLTREIKLFAGELAVSVRKELNEDAVTLVINDRAAFY